VSVNVERRVFDPGDDAFAESAWTLKESIRAAEGVLKQRRGFFMDAYRRSRVYALVERGEEDSIVGFAATRRDGYILFLAVASGYRGEGFGEQLIARVAEDYSTVSCHARATNRSAIEFYQHVGFEIQRRVDSYYEDAGDAYYLKLGDGGLREAVSNLFSDGG
jgi:ribosomal protein S18 acetylase RimI-like enzyme